MNEIPINEMFLDEISIPILESFFKFVILIQGHSCLGKGRITIGH